MVTVSIVGLKLDQSLKIFSTWQNIYKYILSDKKDRRKQPTSQFRFPGQDDTRIHCTHSQWLGRTAVVDHQQMKEGTPSQEQYDRAMLEYVSACHSKQNNYCCRLRSTTATKLCEPKSTCARTKCDDIMSNVLAPWATGLHGQIKLVAIVVSYY